LNLFKADFFSNTSDNAIEIKLLSPSEINEFIRENFRNISTINHITRLSGLNLNSENFKVYTSDGAFLLKYWKLSQTNRINEICNILERLNDLDIVVPSPLRSDSGNFYEKFGSDNISIFKYIIGKSFTPNMNELSLCFESVGELFYCLSKLKSAEAYAPQIPSTVSIFKSIDKLLSSNSILNEKYSDELGDFRKILRSLEKDANIYNNILDLNFKQYCHSDLHPKNILSLSANKYAFLDFDSCYVSNPNISWGFMLLKILREVVSSSNQTINPTELGRNTLLSLKRIQFAKSLLIEQLPIFGRMEVLRRLAYIVDDFEDNNSKIWLDMLPIQISVILESYQLFE
jgi:hypothetical protein